MRKADQMGRKQYKRKMEKMYQNEKERLFKKLIYFQFSFSQFTRQI